MLHSQSVYNNGCCSVCIYWWREVLIVELRKESETKQPITWKYQKVPRLEILGTRKCPSSSLLITVKKMKVLQKNISNFVDFHGYKTVCLYFNYLASKLLCLFNLLSNKQVKFHSKLLYLKLFSWMRCQLYTSIFTIIERYWFSITKCCISCCHWNTLCLANLENRGIWLDHLDRFVGSRIQEGLSLKWHYAVLILFYYSVWKKSFFERIFLIGYLEQAAHHQFFS